MRALLFVVIPLAGCAADTSKLEARIADLERQVADLHRQPAPQPPVSLASLCKQSFSRGYAATTQFDHNVDFDVRSELSGADSIVVEEVRGDRDHFEVGGAYVIRGKYTLATADDAKLAFSERVNTFGVCTSSSGNDSIAVKRGTGTFELSASLPTEGHANVAFFVGGHGTGGVLVGKKGEFLQK